MDLTISNDVSSAYPKSKHRVGFPTAFVSSIREDLAFTQQGWRDSWIAANQLEYGKANDVADSEPTSHKVETLTLAIHGLPHQYDFAEDDGSISPHLESAGHIFSFDARCVKCRLEECLAPQVQVAWDNLQAQLEELAYQQRQVSNALNMTLRISIKVRSIRAQADQEFAAVGAIWPNFKLFLSRLWARLRGK